MERRLLAVAAGVLAVTTLAGGMLLRSGDAAVEMPECARWGLSAEGAQCLEHSLTASIRTRDAGPSDRMLADFLDSNPEYHVACHRIGHDAGAAAFREFTDLADALQTLKEEVCMSAVMHGLMDAWAVSPGARTEWPQAVGLCEAAAERWPEPGEEHAGVGRCADGLGHAAYEISGTAELCAEFRTHQGQRECGSGVVMQAYLPVSRPPDHTPPPLEAMISLCETWPSDILTPEGCYIGVPYALQDALFSENAYRWHSRDAEEAEEAFELFLRGYEEALRYCEKLGGEGYPTCARSTLRWVVHLEEIRKHPEMIEKLCSATDETLRDECYGASIR